MHVLSITYYGARLNATPKIPETTLFSRRVLDVSMYLEPRRVANTKPRWDPDCGRISERKSSVTHQKRTKVIKNNLPGNDLAVETRHRKNIAHLFISYL